MKVANCDRSLTEALFEAISYSRAPVLTEMDISIRQTVDAGVFGSVVAPAFVLKYISQTVSGDLDMDYRADIEP